METPTRCREVGCDEKFDTSHQRDKHENAEHPPESRPFGCSACAATRAEAFPDATAPEPQGFFTEKILEYHRRSVHSEMALEDIIVRRDVTANGDGTTGAAVAIADDREEQRTKLLKGVDVLFSEYWALRDAENEKQAQIDQLSAALNRANSIIARQRSVFADAAALLGGGAAIEPPPEAE